MSSQSGNRIISDDQLTPLNDRQQTVYLAKLERFREYLKTEGKNPRKGIGYDTVTTRISRFHRVNKWIWNNFESTTDFETAHADHIVEALDTDTLRRVDGDRYREGSKRKICDVLVNWFEFHGTEWEPEIQFTDGDAKNNADPYSKRELRQLWQASLTYKSIPRYNNLTPDERDRWKAHLAQELGKPKDKVTPDDWDEVNKKWKIPSLIRTTREAGWRPAMVGKMEVEWYDPDRQVICIPEGEAIKNDAAWEQELTDESAMALDKWLEQRQNMEKYDGRPEIWLNREGNPYDSGSLNNLLRNLMDEAGINPGNRTLVWYSFRHSIGTYVYAEYMDLKIVAEKLRQKSRAAAEKYVHPTPEVKREAAEIM